MLNIRRLYRDDLPYVLGLYTYSLPLMPSFI